MWHDAPVAGDDPHATLGPALSPDPSPVLPLDRAPTQALEALAKTMEGFDGRPSTTLERATVSGGPRMLEQLSKDRQAGLTVKETLGEGGMGLVRRAVQPTLGREVALKSLRPGRHDDGALAKILQEAWVLGRLDHPNIVPVHDIVVDADGTPQIVMKRIEGVAWSELCHEAETIRERFDEDALTWNLRVLMQVCNALSYAHDRDVLHLDIKPENVMIGAFGEVYLMDWGIALALAPDPEGRLPLASECTQILGTPCYIAPEMLEAQGERLGVHTDIYLLGATLYELVSGDPPHRGDNIMNMMHDVVTRDPALEVPCPAALNDLVHRCLARDESKRPASVQAVREGLRQVLDHQDAERLCDTACARADAIESSIAAGTPEARELYDHFSACRFGFDAALERHPDNPRAGTRLAKVTVTMIEWELSQGRAAAAAALANASTSTLGPELHERVQRELQLESARAQKLAALEHDQDPRIGQRTRLFIIAVLGSLWSVLPIGGKFWADPALLNSAIAYVSLSAGFLTLVLAFGVWARDSMSRTAFNRRMGMLLVSTFVVQLCLALVGLRLELAVADTQTMSFMFYALLAAMGAIFADRRFWIIAVGYGLSLVVALASPDLRLFALAAGNLVFTLCVLWIWRMPVGELRRPKKAETS